MNIAEFNLVAGECRSLRRADVAVTGELLKYLARRKVKALSAVMTGCRVEAQRILDFVFGIGNSAPELKPASFPMAELTCVDASQRSLDLATQRFPGLARGLQDKSDQPERNVLDARTV